MRTNPSFRIFKFSTLVPLAIAIAAALVTQPVRATPIQTLTITEVDSNTLTAVLNGTTSLSVTGSADNWLISLTGISGPGGLGRSAFWSEPDASGLNNLVQAQPIANRLAVASDTLPGISGRANNTANTTDFFLNGGELDVTFNDLGDAAAATPDTGSTLGLLALALAALLGASRLRSIRLA